MPNYSRDDFKDCITKIGKELMQSGKGHSARYESITNHAVRQQDNASEFRFCRNEERAIPQTRMQGVRQRRTTSRGEVHDYQSGSDPVVTLSKLVWVRPTAVHVDFFRRFLPKWNVPTWSS